MKIPNFLLACFITIFSSLQANAQETIGTWRIDCEETVCQAYFNLNSGQSEETIVSWSLLSNPDGVSSMIIRVPTFVALPPGLRVWFNDDDSFDIPYQFCDNTGCSAISVVSEGFKRSVLNLNTVKVSFIPYGKSAVAYQVPVNGFEDALKRLQKGK